MANTNRSVEPTATQPQSTVQHREVEVAFWRPILHNVLKEAGPDILAILVISANAFLILTLRTVRKILHEKSILRFSFRDRETRRIQDILAQLAYVAKADRVVLGVFHNGKVHHGTYRMENLAIPFAYERPGLAPLPELRRDVSISVIERELRLLLSQPDKRLVIDKDELDSSRDDCFYYLEARNLNAIVLKLLTHGSLEIAILGFHYQDENKWEEIEETFYRRVEVELVKLCRTASMGRSLWSR